jgi:hypothetical protein
MKSPLTISLTDGRTVRLENERTLKKPRPPWGFFCIHDGKFMFAGLFCR